MPFPTSVCVIEEDPITPEDLVIELSVEYSNRISNYPCPSCNFPIGSTASHTQDEGSHGHTANDICRRAYECIQSSDQILYVYSGTLQPIKFAFKMIEIPPVQEDITETEKQLFDSVKPKWNFNTKYATEEDLTEYFNRNLSVGLELELDWIESTGDLMNKFDGNDSAVSRTFGVPTTGYHDLGACPVCGTGSTREDDGHYQGCWKHLPKNYIRAIENDSSIDGKEFIIYGNNLPSEDFAQNFPLEKMKKFFKATQFDSLHSHAMIVNNVRPIPKVVIQNAWQLFRYYYPSWAFMFGNFSRDNGYIRNHPKHYSDFNHWKVTPFSPKWAQLVKKCSHKGGMSFEHSDIESDLVSNFDLEIRASDASMDMEQIIGVRALTRALILRGAQLAQFGLMSVEVNKDDWIITRNLINSVVSRKITPEQEEAIIKQAKEFLMELSPFLSELERTAISHLINKPVRDRTAHVLTIMPKMPKSVLPIKRLIATTNIKAESNSGWVALVSKAMGVRPEEIETALSHIKNVKFDPELKTMVIGA